MQKKHDVMFKKISPSGHTTNKDAGVRRRHVLVASFGSGAWLGVQAQSKAIQTTLKISAASDLRTALPALLTQFTQQTGLTVQVTYGSSGNFARQIQQGLPVDVFMSADHTWVELLQKTGMAQAQAPVYALGRLAWFSATVGAHAQTDLQLSLAHLVRMKGKLAIANPEHAPYGRAAQQVLQNWGVWSSVQPHLVLGDNVAQAMQFASTGAALAAITALPLVRGPGLPSAVPVMAIDPLQHGPLRQQMVLTKYANALAERWIEFMQTPEVKRHLLSFGFDMETKGKP